MFTDCVNDYLYGYRSRPLGQPWSGQHSVPQDRVLLSGLQRNVRETLQFLYTKRPSIADFQHWAADLCDSHDRLHQAFAGQTVDAPDAILWHHHLPHGSSPNRARRPRVVQYLSMHPTVYAHNDQWL